ncbi:TPA: transcriptional regulator [Klebsiella aerogenes]|uniref:HTH cro/C1-type domain-containing protein n=2 Tax=Morganellaceae TaxID=1903414 RepID=A0A1I3XBZ7_9GAMM|nr:MULTISPECIES: transcriptional regulator [Enterobacterales]APG53517.1 hypothetical protein BGK56_21500 [Providencia stuartii]EAW3267845.1 transcriptional regulator [Salmonella enterica]HBS0237579.1 transcriptional regulator [Klebsiella aerogenes]EEP1426246.1 transcriptional regulator [Salmonella enterica]EGN1944290.1 transcriptional regulator [Salmonella enterica]
MENNAKNIKALRLKTGLTQKEMAERYGVGIRTWQKKEEDGTQSSQKLSNFDFEYLLLLAGEHPDFVLEKRNKEIAS